MKATSILAVETELGELTLSYEELEERFGVENMRKVFAGSGIRHRRVAAPDTCGSDLAFRAANRLLKKCDVARESIDLLIVCTQSPDHWLPSTACILQDRLKLKTSCAAFDINLGCSQYVYALSVAHSMIVAGCASLALVLTGDTMSRLTHPLDRSVTPLLGDAGSATLVGSVADGEGFRGFEMGTDGSGHDYLIVPAGGARQPITATGELEAGGERGPANLRMNGVAVFHFAISTVPRVIGSLLERLGMKMMEIDLFVFHQANRYMIEHIMKSMKIPADKTHFYIEEIGNTSGSSLPLALADAGRAGKVTPGSKVLVIGFGVGLSWAATVLCWPESAYGFHA